MSEHASRFALERHRLGETDAAREHIESCAECLERLRAMEAEDRAFRIAKPNLSSIGASPKKDRIEWIAPLFALAAFSAAILLALPEPEVRMKGDSHVELLVKRGGDTFAYDERPLHRGDTLVFRYTSAHRHMLLAGVEASGEVSIYVPDAALEPGQNRIAPQGVELDDYLGEERVIVFLSDEPLDPDRVERALASDSSAGYDAEVVSFVIRKEPP